MTTALLSDSSLEATPGSHVYIPELAGDYRSYHTGKVIKTITNPNPELVLTMTNRINLPPFCTATDNPGPNSYLTIKYKSQGNLLEVFTFEKYVNSFIGNMVVRDVEFMAQEIAKEAATVLGQGVEVFAYFELVGFRYGQSVSCEFSISDAQAAKYREEYPAKFAAYLEKVKAEKAAKAANKVKKDATKETAEEATKEAIKEVTKEATKDKTTAKAEHEENNQNTDQAFLETNKNSEQLPQSTYNLEQLDPNSPVPESCPYHQRLNALASSDAQLAQLIDQVVTDTATAGIVPTNPQLAPATSTINPYGSEELGLRCEDYALEDEGYCPQSKVYGKAGDCPVIHMLHLRKAEKSEQQSNQSNQSTQSTKSTQSPQTLSSSPATSNSYSNPTNATQVSGGYVQSAKAAEAMARQAAKASKPKHLIAEIDSLLDND